MTELGKAMAQPTLGFLLRTLYAHLQSSVYARLRDEGIDQIRPAFSPVFRFLDENGSRLTDLAQATGITKQSMAYLIEEMTELGWVQSEPDEDDRRAKRVVWTAAGRRIQQRVAETSRQVEAEWAEQVGTESWAECRSTLERLVDALR